MYEGLLIWLYTTVSNVNLLTYYSVYNLITSIVVLDSFTLR